MHSCSIFWGDLFTLADGKKVPLESGKWQLHEYQRRNWQLRRELDSRHSCYRNTFTKTQVELPCLSMFTLNQVWENSVWKIWKCVRLSEFNMATPPTKSMPCETSILRRQTWLQCCHLGPGHSAHCFSHVGAPGRVKGRIRVRIENLLGGSSSLDH
jgi:hypothetical protein